MSRTGVAPSTTWEEFTTSWVEAANSDDDLARLAHGAEFNFALASGPAVVRVGVGAGAVRRTTASPAFTLHAPEAAWDLFFEQLPPPAYQNFFGMLMRVDGARVEGDQLAFAQHVHIVRRVLEVARSVASGPGAEVEEPRHAQHGSEPASADGRTGSYVSVNTRAGSTSLYVEQAGRGRDLLLLHTAGADSRQYRHLMNDPRLSAEHRMVAFDLPGHGRSDALPGVRPGGQMLTTDEYVECIMGVVRTLGLNQPIVVGASMAGAICLELAYRHPDELGGVVACEASDKIEGRQVPWARHPRVNESLFVPEWVDGLMAPHSPKKYREEIWWGYSQGGYGTFFGDILFYSGEWDGRDRMSGIDTGRCPVAMLTGEYDYSCTPAMSRATAGKIPGATFQVMHELGHFPHAENPPRFVEYLLPALAQMTRS